MTHKNKKHYAITKQKHLTDVEYSELLTHLHRLLATESRNATLLFLAIYTGGRAQELLNLRKRDIDITAQSIYIRGLKGSNDREIPLPAWLFELTTSAAQKSPTQFIFPITYPRLDQIWTSLRTVQKKFHALRHTFAIRLYERTKDIHLVKTALGHRNIQNTMVYVDYSYSKQDLRRLIVE